MSRSKIELRARGRLVFVCVLGFFGLVGAQSLPSASQHAPASGSGSTQPGANPLASLPTIPWSGGAAFYAKFPGSSAWANPDVFPIGAWWADWDSAANIAWDKDHGIDFYTQLNGTENGALLDGTGVSWVGSTALKGMSANDPAWVGNFLDDEIDGRYDPATGQAALQKEIDAASPGRFDEANFTAIVASDFNAAQLQADDTYVNMVNGPVSVDAYWYTDDHCYTDPSDDTSFWGVDPAHCATASSYGELIRAVRARDASDGILKPVFGFVENGAPSSTNGRYITPAQEQGAAMDMVINGANGIIWFNQSFSGSCQSGNVLRQAEADPSGCNAARVAAMKTVDDQLQVLAPVLNTPSYYNATRSANGSTDDYYSFGNDTDAMVKWYNGSAYIFAMISGDKASQPGSRIFALPAGLASARAVTVLNEGRTIPVTGGSFTDSFAAESSYHVYRVTP
ncbi:MAG: hypothetical protein FWD85_00085 [Microbacteriaceae bacterium]|nr:hypothetical protein [Microbacteriaceae bacterium]MCL2793681.1 hypothetical protein [Microbacteriaceae bacterium]